MVIREAGILVRGYPIVYSSYHQTGKKEIDIVLRSGFLSGLLNFIKSAYTGEIIEYIEGSKFTMAFKMDKIKGKFSVKPEPIVAYVILDNKKKIDNFIRKNVNPFLLKVLKQFIGKFSKKNLSIVSEFENFTKSLDKVFGMESKSIEDNFKVIIS